MPPALAQLAKLLAVPAGQRRKITVEADIEPLLRRGLPAAALGHVHQALAVPVAEFSPLLGISPRSFYDMQKRKRIDMTVSDRLYRVAQVIAAATELFQSRPKAIGWMHAPLPALAGETPFSKLGTEIGAARVHEVLTAIEHGVYV
ncbi:MAG: DUF2384 domain-containing protein [Nevskia sp.]|nr:DUF2384 domain-containing protein [Nevskia sp.]